MNYIRFSCALAALDILFFSFLAYKTGDYHMLNRGGATLAAVGALFVLYQVNREIQITKKIKTSYTIEPESPANPISRIAGKRASSFKNTLRKERNSLIIGTTIVTGIGEILHGWGDLLLKWGVAVLIY